MTIELNGENITIDPNITLEKLMVDNDLSQKKGIAIAVNMEVVPRSYWKMKDLKENDNIMIIQATQGG